MPRMNLNLESMGEFDHGKPRVMFSQCLAQAVKDIMDRPGESAERTVTFVAHLVPMTQQDGDVVDAGIFFTCSTKLPKHSTEGRPVGIARGGSLFFVPDEEAEEVDAK